VAHLELLDEHVDRSPVRGVDGRLRAVASVSAMRPKRPAQIASDTRTPAAATTTPATAGPVA
jgi:hypothetical protein